MGVGEGYWYCMPALHHNMHHNMHLKPTEALRCVGLACSSAAALLRPALVLRLRLLAAACTAGEVSAERQGGIANNGDPW